jgi:hypothetical protein
MRGTVEQTENGIRIQEVPKQNDPKVLAAYGEALKENVESRNPQPDFSFTVHTYFDESRAKISWIRSGYLAAFAAIGYGYTVRDMLTPVRQQLQHPDDETLPACSIREPDASPAQRRVLVVNDPPELDCIAVVMGERTIFLPGIFDPKTFGDLADRLSRRTDTEGRLTVRLSGKEIPWPRRATYFLD